MTLLIALAFWANVLLFNFGIAEEVPGMGGETLMLLVFPLLVVLWGTLGAVTP